MVRSATALVLLLAGAMPALAQHTLLVDVDGKASATDCAGNGRAYRSIQAALDAAAPGDTISVCPGVYDEQIVLQTDGVTLTGAGAGLTRIRPSSVQMTTTSLTLGTGVRPIVLVAASNVTIRSIAIDGSLADAGTIPFADCRVIPFYLGIFFRGGSGTVSAANVTQMASASACAHAIRAENALVTLTGSLLDRYTNNGISCAGALAYCKIVGNTIRGRGPVTDEVQSGIQIRSMAAGTIEGNTVADHFLVGANGVGASSAGILLFYFDPSVNGGLVKNNVFSNNQVDVQRQSAASAF